MNSVENVQISNTHRLIRFIQKISSKPNAVKDRFISIEHFINNIIKVIDLNLNFTVLDRQERIFKKTKECFKKPTKIEILTKAFYDPYFFRNSHNLVDYETLKNKLVTSIDVCNGIEIMFPIFSRKPISPVKNRGYFADVAEISAVLKIASFSKIIQKIIDKDITFIILADGKKYNRACKTPDFIVDEYQNSIRFWVEYFGINNFIKIVDYEKYIFDAIGEEAYLLREERFKNKYNDISLHFDKFFNLNNIENSLLNIKKYPFGEQIYYTFYSVVSSINYSLNIDYSLYIKYIKMLHSNIKNTKFGKIFLDMRNEVWIATKKYVAISLVDRENDILNKINPNGIKFTIHQKPNELRFIETNFQNFNITAQHCVGGLEIKNGRISTTFDYRICRESRGEQAICISSLESNRANLQIYGYLVKMSQINQPVYYQRNINESV